MGFNLEGFLMYKPKYIALGSALVIYGLCGIDMKETYFSWDGYFFVFDRYESFTEYWITISCIFYFGFKYLMKGLLNSKEEYIEPLAFVIKRNITISNKQKNLFVALLISTF